MNVFRVELERLVYRLGHEQESVAWVLDVDDFWQVLVLLLGILDLLPRLRFGVYFDRHQVEDLVHVLQNFTSALLDRNVLRWTVASLDLVQCS